MKPDGAGGWNVLVDEAHGPVGGLAVSKVTSTGIYVTFDPASRIHTFLVAADETLGSQNMTAGASVALNYAFIWIGDKNGVRLNPTQIRNTNGNLWVFGLFTPVVSE